MKMLYHPVLAVMICTLCFTSTQAQRQLNRTQRAATKPSIDAGIAAVCDTINFPIDPSWDRMSETANDQGDFVNGTNHFHDLQKANFFDLSATASAYLIRTFIAFGNANS